MPRTLRTASLALGLLLTGCVHQPSAPGDPECTALFAARDAASAQSSDGQYRRLEGFSGLRSDRLLAALGRRASSPAQRRLWLRQLAERDAEASRIELGNLPPAVQADWLGPQQQARLASCQAAQVERLSRDPEAFAQALVAARVPDDYNGWARIFGAYPLFEPVYRRGIAAWQAQASRVTAPPDSAQWLAYQPLESTAAPLGPVRQDALGLPQPSAEQRAALFARHAPTLRIEQLGRADRLGSPGFDRAGRSFDTQAPQLYQHLGWSWLEGRWRLQLVYQLWFSHRPKPQPLDLYGGELDGLIWRVTLGDQGDAWLYDAIHPCGCWHAFFLPSDSPLRFRQPADQEARQARRLAQDGRRAATLWLTGGEHALAWVDDRRPAYPAIGYRRIALDQLRQLPHPLGRRSLYEADGLVAGSERLERWLLWPSGVPSPGAMRQWGRHATAFVGRAQFDDPHLLERYFSVP